MSDPPSQDLESPILVDGDVLAALNSMRSPNESLNETLRRVLKLESHDAAPTSAITTRKQFMRPILQVLSKLGGRGHVDTISSRLELLMKPILKPIDYEEVANEVRWWNTARFARDDMVKGGLLARNSPRGIWEITEAGRRFIADAK